SRARELARAARLDRRPLAAEVQRRDRELVPARTSLAGGVEETGGARGQQVPQRGRELERRGRRADLVVDHPELGFLRREREDRAREVLSARTVEPLRADDRR